MEVIKAFMKTKGNEENIYKMLNAWLRNCRNILTLDKEKGKKEEEGNKGYKEKDQKKMLGEQLSSF